MNHTLDASAVLRYLDNEAGADEVKKLFLDAYHQRTELYVCTVNWSEILYTCHKRGGPGSLSRLSAAPVILISVDEPLASLAANYRLNFKLHLADAFALATAMQTKSTLVTADYDFKAAGLLPGPVHLLPRK
jgi:predicted nucleic acid-binding protein